VQLDLVGGALLALGGVISGFVNTVAGGGSIVTVPLLVEILGDPLVANGTNRVAILMQNVVALLSFSRSKVVPWKIAAPLILPVLLGAGAGAWVATQVDASTMKLVFAVVIVGVALSILISPGRWRGGDARLGPIGRALAFAAIGFYGGLVQAGVGFLMLAALVLGGGLTLVTGNAAKVLLVLAYTMLTLPIFIYAGHVAPLAGLALAVGNMAGAWFAARLAITKGSAWIRWVLVAASLIAAARMLTLL